MTKVISNKEGEYSMWLLIEGKAAIVTGGGQGIGTADVANVVLFLSSHLADYMTGRTFFADGGRACYR